MVLKTTLAELCIYVVSWNVGTRLPGDISLTSLLSLNGTGNCRDNRAPDIYVIGLQEVGMNSKVSAWGISQDKAWEQKFSACLENNGYYNLKSEQMRGILIAMFMRSQHLPYIRNLQSQETRTGFGGLWGNKGAVSIRMTLYGTTVAFVCSHLAAHENKVLRRIDDYNKILNDHHYSVRDYQNIVDHDVVFWFGDLNFRLQGNDPFSYIENVALSGNISELLIHDELTILMEGGQAFSDFSEETITFKPTYKYISGTDLYDPSRRPAWCDRILYRLKKHIFSNRLNIKQNFYKSSNEYIISDHKPVSAEFVYTIYSNSDDRYSAALEKSSTSSLSSTLFILQSVLSLLKLICYNNIFMGATT